MRRPEQIGGTCAGEAHQRWQQLPGSGTYPELWEFTGSLLGVYGPFMSVYVPGTF